MKRKKGTAVIPEAPSQIIVTCSEMGVASLGSISAPGTKVNGTFGDVVSEMSFDMNFLFIESLYESNLPLEGVLLSVISYDARPRANIQRSVTVTKRRHPRLFPQMFMKLFFFVKHVFSINSLLVHVHKNKKNILNISLPVKLQPELCLSTECVQA